MELEPFASTRLRSGWRAAAPVALLGVSDLAVPAANPQPAIRVGPASCRYQPRANLFHLLSVLFEGVFRHKLRYCSKALLEGVERNRKLDVLTARDSEPDASVCFVYEIPLAMRSLFLGFF